MLVASDRRVSGWCAGRTAQEVNFSRLGADAGVSSNTARAWLGVLEASYLVVQLPAWHRNVREQVRGGVTVLPWRGLERAGWA